MRLTTSIKIGTVLKTRIRVHYTWLIVFILIPWTVSTQYSVETSLLSRVLLGCGTAAAFFLSVFLREVGLLILAGSKGVTVRSVTIFAFGGLIQTDEETISPSVAMLLAVSGMLGNFLITILFYLAYLFFGDEGNLFLNIPLKWLAFFYFTLGLFHILPIYPVEGGRVVNALIWKLTGNGRKAALISSVSGWILGFLVMAGGILLAVFTAERFTGLFFTGLGLIIQNAATHGFRYAKAMARPVSGEMQPIEDDPLPTEEEPIPVPVSGPPFFVPDIPEGAEPAADEPVDQESDDDTVV